MSRLAQLIAKEEGWGIPGALPTRNNNPGDLRHSPHSFHTAQAPNAIGRIDTPEHGWEDLERQLRIFANSNMTLRQAIYQFAPPSENNTEGYLAYVCKGLGMGPDTLVSRALEVPMADVATTTGWTPTGSTAASALGASVVTVVGGLVDWLWPGHPMPMALSAGIGALVVTVVSFFHPDGGRR